MKHIGDPHRRSPRLVYGRATQGCEPVVPSSNGLQPSSFLPLVAMGSNLLAMGSTERILAPSGSSNFSKAARYFSWSDSSS